MHAAVANDTGRTRNKQHVLFLQGNGAGTRKAGRAWPVLCGIVVSRPLARIFDMPCRLAPRQKINVYVVALAAHGRCCRHAPRGPGHGLLALVKKPGKGHGPALVEGTIHFHALCVCRIDVWYKIPDTPQLREAGLAQHLEQLQIMLLHRCRTRFLCWHRQAETAPQHMLVVPRPHMAVLDRLHGCAAVPALLPQWAIGRVCRLCRNRRRADTRRHHERHMHIACTLRKPDDRRRHRGAQTSIQHAPQHIPARRSHASRRIPWRQGILQQRGFVVNGQRIRHEG